MTAEPVYVPRLLRDQRPVYHLRGGSRPLRPEIPRGYELRTLCGRVVYRVGYDGIERVAVHTLRCDHAASIGRVCRRCYAADARAKGYDL